MYAIRVPCTDDVIIVNNYPVQAAVPTHLGCRGDSQQLYCKEGDTFQEEYELSKLPCQSYTQAAQEHEPQGDGLQGRTCCCSKHAMYRLGLREEESMFLDLWEGLMYN